MITFAETYLTWGTTDIDDWVEHWHATNGAPRGWREPLEEYLGLSFSEYATWVEHPSLLRGILDGKCK